MDLQQKHIELQNFNSMLENQNKMQAENLSKQREIQDYLKEIDYMCNQFKQEKLAYENKIKELVDKIILL